MVTPDLRQMRYYSAAELATLVGGQHSAGHDGGLVLETLRKVERARVRG